MQSPETKVLKDFYNMKQVNGDVGIEVEMEFDLSVAPVAAVEGAWKVYMEEHSLRNGFEYITRRPIKVGPDKFEKIKYLTDILSANKAKPSTRCSVHVHRNVSEFTPIQIWNTLIAGWLLEKPLLEYCGNQRKSNLFCLGINEASGIVSSCVEDITRNKVPFSRFNAESCKYGNQNLNAISRLGSIEYRGMRGTVDPHLIDTWSSGVFHIGEIAKSFKDPHELIETYLDSEKDTFIAMFLTPQLLSEVVKIEGYGKLVRKNISHVADIVYAVDDWHEWQSKLEVQQPRKIKYNILDQLPVAGVSINPNIIQTEPIFYEDV